MSRPTHLLIPTTVQAKPMRICPATTWLMSFALHATAAPATPKREETAMIHFLWPVRSDNRACTTPTASVHGPMIAHHKPEDN